jgi:uncharacterized protein
MSYTTVLPAWFAQAIAGLKTGDIDAWMAIYALDAVHEFPFSPEGAVHRLDGRDAIAAYMRQLPGMIQFGELRDIRVRETGDEFVVEATGHHRRISDNSAREISYIWFITMRDGKVIHFRDYMNPLQLKAF